MVVALILGTAVSAASMHAMHWSHNADACSGEIMSCATDSSANDLCLRHCIAQSGTALPTAPPMPFIFVALFAIFVVTVRPTLVKRHTLTLSRRLTEGIERLRLSAELQTVIIRD